MLWLGFGVTLFFLELHTYPISFSCFIFSVILKPFLINCPRRHSPLRSSTLLMSCLGSPIAPLGLFFVVCISFFFSRPMSVRYEFGVHGVFCLKAMGKALRPGPVWIAWVDRLSIMGITSMHIWLYHHHRRTGYGLQMWQACLVERKKKSIFFVVPFGG